MICWGVVVPQPEGPMRQVKLPGFSSKRRSRSTTVSAPAAERKALRSILTSSRPGERAGPPAVDMGFKRLNHHEFNEQHDADEGQGIAEDGSHVEQLEIEMNLKAEDRKSTRLNSSH